VARVWLRIYFLDVLAFWRFGALALWRFGALALWRFGALALWQVKTPKRQNVNGRDNNAPRPIEDAPKAASYGLR
jgi:hypothetical protein